MRKYLIRQYGEEITGDSEVYGAWMKAVGVNNERNAENFVYKYVSGYVNGNDDIKAIYKKYRVSEAG